MARFLSRLGRAVAVAAALTAGASTAALADFRGGGALMEFTPGCAANGWPVGSTLPVRVRHAPSEMVGFPTQVTIATPRYQEHLAVWQNFAATTVAYNALGRGLGTFFQLHPNWPRVRPVQRLITALVNPSGGATVENAREMVLRLRIVGFNDTPTCSATLVTVLRRF